MGVIIALWRAGLRISEALALAETDLDRQRGAVLVRAGKGGRRRGVGMDRWAWEACDHAPSRERNGDAGSIVIDTAADGVWVVPLARRLWNGGGGA